MKRYELLSYKINIETNLAEGIDKDVDWSDIEKFRDYPNRPFIRSINIFECLSFLVLRHLEFRAKEENVVRALQTGTDIVLDFFFGDWMEGEYANYFDPNSFDPEDEMDWLAGFWSGLLFSYLKNDESTCLKLSERIRDDFLHDETTREMLKEDTYFYILLAYFLSERRSEREAELEAAIEKARGKRAKMLLGCLKSLRAQDAEKFGEQFGLYLKRFLTVEMKGRYNSDYISIEGSILWHAARTRGLALPTLPEKQQALIITRETLGLD